MPIFVYVNSGNSFGLVFRASPVLPRMACWGKENAKRSRRRSSTLRCPGARICGLGFGAKGFGFRVRPSGARSYVVVYRPVGEGRQAAVRRVTLGAPERSRLTKRGRPPGSDSWLGRSWRRPGRPIGRKSAAPRPSRTSPSVSRGACGGQKQARDSDQIPLCRLGIHHPGIRAHEALRHYARRRGEIHHDNAERPTIANYIVAVLSAIFTFGQTRGLIPDDMNPTRHVERFEEEKRERFLTIAELARLGEALREAETTGLPWRRPNEEGPKAKHLAKPENRLSQFDPAAVAAVRLLMFTGCRLREILHLRGSEIDFERGLLFLGDSKLARNHRLERAGAGDLAGPS